MWCAFADSDENMNVCAFYVCYVTLRSVRVDVPGGVENGLAINMRGEGAEGDPGAPKGDLYVQLEVLPDPYFERSGADVHVTAGLQLAQVKTIIEIVKTVLEIVISTVRGEWMGRRLEKIRMHYSTRRYYQSPR